MTSSPETFSRRLPPRFLQYRARRNGKAVSIPAAACGKTRRGSRSAVFGHYELFNGVAIIRSEHEQSDAPEAIRTSDLVLDKSLALVLLRRLSSDDAYRALYEADPGQALAAIGVSSELIGKISAHSLAPMKLADKGVLGEALELLRKDDAEVCLCQIPPQARIAFGSSAKSRVGSTISFAEV